MKPESTFNPGKNYTDKFLDFLFIVPICMKYATFLTKKIIQSNLTNLFKFVNIKTLFLKVLHDIQNA